MSDDGDNDDWRSVSEDSFLDEEENHDSMNMKRHFEINENGEEDDDEKMNPEEIDVDEDIKNELEKEMKKSDDDDDESLGPRRSISHDDLLNLGRNSNREESRSAGSSRTEGSEDTFRRKSRSVKKQTSKKERINSDESDDYPWLRESSGELSPRHQYSSDDLTPRYRLESFENPFSFDDTEERNSAGLEDDDDDDDEDETFNFQIEKTKTHDNNSSSSVYSDPSDDDERVGKRKSKKKSEKKKVTTTDHTTMMSSGPSKKNYFSDDEDSKSNLFPELTTAAIIEKQKEHSHHSPQQVLSITNSLKSLQKATSVVTPFDDRAGGEGGGSIVRQRTESDKSSTSRDTSKENDIRSPFLTTSFSSSNHPTSSTSSAAAVSPEYPPHHRPSDGKYNHKPPHRGTSSQSPKSPPSLMSDQIIEDILPSSTDRDTGNGKNVNDVSIPSSPVNKPSPLQVMASQRWKTPTRKSKQNFAKFTEVHSFANAVKIVPDNNGGALVLCATADSTVRLIDAITGKIIGMYEGHTDRVLAVSINEKISTSKEGEGEGETVQYVVAGSRDENVCVWNYKTRNCLQILSGHDGAVWAVAVYVSQYGPPLAFSGSSDCSIRSWNILTGEVQHIFKGHSDTVLSLTIYNGGGGGERVISGGADHMIRIWDMTTGRHCRMLEGHTDDVNTVAIVEDYDEQLFQGIKIISGGRDRIVRVWDLQQGTQIAEFPGHADCIYGVCGMVGRFETLQGISTSTKPSGGGGVGGVGGGAGHTATATKTPSTRLNRGTVVGNVKRSPSIWKNESHGTRDVTELIPEIFLIVSCSEDRTIKLWDVLGERLLVTSKQHKGSVKGISLSPIMIPGDALTLPSVSLLLASCSWDKSVLFYDVDLLLTTEEKKCCTIS